MLLSFLAGCSFGLQAIPALTDQALEDAAAAAAEDGLIETAVSLEGRLYAISPDDLTVVDPPGLDGMFGELLTRDVLVYVEGETEDTLQLDVALAGADGRQDPCEQVRRFPAGDWTQNPVFDVGPGELTTSFGGGHPASFRELELSGVFDEDAHQWREGTLSAMLDTRELQAAVGEGDLCDTVDALGGLCVACDDGEPVCFHLGIEDIVAEMLDAGFDPEPSGCE